MQKKSLLLFLCAAAVLYASGCESLASMFSHTAYGYNQAELAAVPGERPDALWRYPSAAEMAALAGPENAHGTGFPDTKGDITLNGQESPLVLDWTLDGDGRILIAEAAAYETELRVGETGIHQYWHTIPSAFRVYALSEEDGTELWSFNISGFRGGILSWFPAGPGRTAMTVTSTSLKGTEDSFACLVISNGDGTVLSRLVEPNPVSSVFYHEDSDTVILKVNQTDGESNVTSEIWKGFSASGGDRSWRLMLNGGETVQTLGDRIFLISRSGTLYSVDPGSGDTASFFDAGELSWVVPAGDLLLVNGQESFLLDPVSGTVNWSSGDLGEMPETAVAAGDLILLCRTDTRLDLPPKGKGQSPHKKAPNPDVLRRYDHNTVTLTALDRASGAAVWTAILNDKITGGPLRLEENLILTTPENLQVLDPRTGDTVRIDPLPWNRPWVLGLQLIPWNGGVLMESDLLAAFWSFGDGFLRSHEFRPLWKSVSSEALYYDIRAGYWILEKNLNTDLGMSWVEASINETEDWRRRVDQAYYRSNRDLISSQNSMTLMWNNAQWSAVNNSTPGYVTSLQKQMAGLGAMMAWSTAVNKQATGMNFLNNQVAYPYIRHEVERLTRQDRWPWILRPVSLGQTHSISAVEAFNFETGEVRPIILGPRQASNVIDLTLADGATGIGIYGGYLPYINILPHSYRFLADWERGLLIHYGPGFREESRVPVAGSQNLRGIIFARDIRNLLD